MELIPLFVIFALVVIIAGGAMILDHNTETPASKGSLGKVLLAVAASGALVAIPVSERGSPDNAAEIQRLKGLIETRPEVRVDDVRWERLRAPKGAEEREAVENLQGELQEAGYDVITLDDETIAAERHEPLNLGETPPSEAISAPPARQHHGAIGVFAR